MYICICHAVTDREIREAVSRGVTTLSALSAHLGVATGCGSCATEILSMLPVRDADAGRPPYAFSTPALLAAGPAGRT